MSVVTSKDINSLEDITSEKFNPLQDRNEIIQNNSNKDPVTLADLKVNELIIQRIKANFVNISY